MLSLSDSPFFQEKKFRRSKELHCIAPYFGLRPVASCRQYSALIFSDPDPFPACSIWKRSQEFKCETFELLSAAAALAAVPDREDISNERSATAAAKPDCVADGIDVGRTAALLEPDRVGKLKAEESAIALRKPERVGVCKDEEIPAVPVAGSMTVDHLELQPFLVSPFGKWFGNSFRIMKDDGEDEDEDEVEVEDDFDHEDEDEDEVEDEDEDEDEDEVEEEDEDEDEDEDEVEEEDEGGGEDEDEVEEEDEGEDEDEDEVEVEEDFDHADEDEDENGDENEDEDEDESEDGDDFDHEDENEITLLKICQAFEDIYMFFRLKEITLLKICRCQDLLRLVHNMLPLERIHKPEDPALLKKNKCWSNTEQGAYNFAAPERVAQLGKAVQPTWFYTGDDGLTCRFGLKDDFILQAIQVLKEWMLPRPGANPHHDKRQEQMSWRQTLHFHRFEIPHKEVEELAATAITVLYVRWQWISAWLIAEKAKLPACSSGADAAF
eukprot:s645_g18.t1